MGLPSMVSVRAQTLAQRHLRESRALLGSPVAT